MKKAFHAILCAGLLTPLFAVTWQMQSSPFLLGTAVLDRNMAKMSYVHLGSSYETGKGIVTFKYMLPSNTKSATLNIYSVNGVKVKSFNLISAATSIQWCVAKDRVATGIYFASLQVGSVEKTSQITIVK
jgi:hypothetical protein